LRVNVNCRTDPVAAVFIQATKVAAGPAVTIIDRKVDANPVAVGQSRPANALAGSGIVDKWRDTGVRTHAVAGRGVQHVCRRARFRNTTAITCRGVKELLGRTDPRHATSLACDLSSRTAIFWQCASRDYECTNVTGTGIPRRASILELA